MTFRMQRSTEYDVVVLALSGNIGEDCASELQGLLNGEAGRRVVLDLKDLDLIDRTGVLLLVRSQIQGTTFRNCPAYVKQWIEREEVLMPSTQTASVSEGTFKSTEGVNIFYRSWRPMVTPRAVVVIVPGFNSHSGYYQWVGTQLAATGCGAFALDLRGRGKSDGECFYVNTFTDYVSDVAAAVSLARSTEANAPVFLLGHSAGGVVACLYAIEHQTELAGLICESFAFQVPAPDFALAVFKGLAHLAPHAHILHLKNEDFSRDPSVVETMNADPLIGHETQPTQTLAEMVRADERLKQEFPRITLPVLILHGTADKATKPAGSQLFYDTAGSSDKTLKLYDGGFHDLLNDIDKQQVMADVTALIGAHLAAA
jgi:acylglycerol lipase